MEGAEHDSWQRDPPPRCHPDTRASILQRANEWIDDPRREKKVLWVRGPAGVGKSAIVQTLAELLSPSGRLGATIFFSRPNGRSNSQKVFPTLAYQLATRDASYKAYINDLMITDSRPLELKAMKEQFQLLIVEPFVRRGLRKGQGDMLITIDGLDECDGDPIPDNLTPIQHRGRSIEEVQREIIRLISAFVQSHPSIPLIWIIASRPETHLKAIFFADGVKDGHIEEDIPIDSTEACEDVEKFLHSSFTTIRENFPDHIQQMPWPSHNIFLQIAKAAKGLFAFAQVVIRFIEDPRVGNPVAQLEYVLAAIAKLHKSQQSTHPLSALDAIYTAILDKVPHDVFHNTKCLLQIVLHCHRRTIKVSDFTFHNMCNYAQISIPAAVTALRHLHSVVHFPQVKDIGASRPRLYHASFGDYLEDSSRSHTYAIHKWPINNEKLVTAYLGSTPGQFTHSLAANVLEPDPETQDLLTKEMESSKRETFYKMKLAPILKQDTSGQGVHIKFLGAIHTVSWEVLRPHLQNFNFQKMVASEFYLDNIYSFLPLHQENVYFHLFAVAGS
jgi:hypothetical protein